MKREHTVILIEDDVRLRELVSKYLRAQLFNVVSLSDGAGLVDAVAEHQPDVIILDIMLPGDDGFTLCRRVREKYSVPLLFMTAKNEAIDEILGLEMGADDYIVKPVEPRLLLARIQALLRRVRPQPVKQLPSLSFGNLHIDRQARSVRLNGNPIPFTSHEFDILLILAENAGTVVLRDTIYTQIIGREYDGLDRSADVRISRIRKKLNDDPQHPYRIKTIWGKGFFFVADAWS